MRTKHRVRASVVTRRSSPLFLHVCSLVAEQRSAHATVGKGLITDLRRDGLPGSVSCDCNYHWRAMFEDFSDTN